MYQVKFEIYLFDKALSPKYNSFFISGNDEEDAVIEEESLSGTPEVVEDEVVADTENLEEEEKSGGVEVAGVDDGLMQWATFRYKFEETQFHPKH